MGLTWAQFLPTGYEYFRWIAPPKKLSPTGTCQVMWVFLFEVVATMWRGVALFRDSAARPEQRRYEVDVLVCSLTLTASVLNTFPSSLDSLTAIIKFNVALQTYNSNCFIIDARSEFALGYL